MIVFLLESYLASAFGPPPPSVRVLALDRAGHVSVGAGAACADHRPSPLAGGRPRHARISRSTSGALDPQVRGMMREDVSALEG